MLNHFRMLLIAFVASIPCLSTLASLPEFPLFLTDINGPEVPPSDLWTTDVEYCAVTSFPNIPISRNYLFREHLYDFTGDGTFSIMPNREYKAPVFTSIFPDGKVYCLDRDGHRLFRYNGAAYDVLLDEDYRTIKSLIPFDYNNDGKFDFKYGDDVYSIDNAGNMSLDALTLLTPEQYEGLRSELKLTTGGEGVPGMGDMFGRDGGASTGGISSFADFNADGLTDVLISGSANTLFLNAGKDRTLIYASAPKTELIRDFDGDGLVDMVIKETDGLKIYLQRRGQPSQVINAYRGFSGSVLGARDVDNDGDIDLIVGASSRGDSTTDYYLAVIENLGTGKFAKRENFLVNINNTETNSFKFHDIVDVDADGKYEIIFSQYLEGGYRICSVKIESASTLGKITEISRVDSDEFRDVAATIVPVCNDGRMAYPAKWSDEMLYWLTKPEWNVNSRPARPVAPTLNYDPATRRLAVSWQAGSDAETPVVDLTYELRIGTSEDAGDIVAANALPDGTRRNIAEGSNGFAREKVYDVSTWPAGNIYVSYQVVDGCWRGSEFSPVAVFENDCPGAAIAMNAEIPGAGNPIEAWVENGPVSGFTYVWSCSEGGTVNVIDAEKQRIAVTFPTPGKKTITLTVTDTQGRTATVIRKIDVNPQSVKVHFDNDWTRVNNAMDLDCDGVLEINSLSGFYVQKPDGTFEKYRRMFNSDYHHGITFDYNRDGFPDIVGYDVLLNTGDGDMEILNGVSTVEWKYDLNNDGFADTGSSINSGDYSDSKQITGGKFEPMLFYDYNGDGLLDNIYNLWDSQNRIYHIMYNRNIDGLTFADAEELFTSENGVDAVADIDGDGTMDFLCSNYGYAFGVTSYSEYITIRWGNGDAPTLVQCPDGRPFDEISTIVDLDNNGVLDLIVKLQTEESPAYPDCVAVYIYADHTYANHAEREEATGIAFINSAGNYRANYDEFILPVQNKLPEPPSGLRAVQSPENVVIEWNPGSDEETPAKALRYNISVKHKGAEGENAYLISPMNGDNDLTPLPMPMRLLTSTKFTIPVASMPAGEYEIKLQSVDTHMGASKFSEKLSFTVEESALIEMPTTVVVGEMQIIRVYSNYNSTIDFGEGSDASVHGSANGSTIYAVTWSTEGRKEIKADRKIIASTMAVTAPDASFLLPEKVLARTSVRIPGAAEGKWTVSTDDGATWNPVGSISDVTTRVADSDYVVMFAKAGSYLLRRTVTRNDIDGKAESMVTVVDEGTPEMSFVSCDGNSHYQLNWNALAIPAEVIGVKVYHETENYGVFALIGEVAPSEGAFTDVLSNAAVCPSRYRISWVLPYGESEPSAEYQPVHVQINKGMGEAINLMWSFYQGAQVESYRILRGTSPDNLETFATVSGNIGSYTDFKPDGVKYYAIETVVASPDVSRSVRSALDSPRSKVVCSSEARDVVLAQSISIISPSGSNTLYMSNPRNMLTAAIMPSMASSCRVSWEIVAGADKASIDAYGRLTYHSPGTISVKATACDGSGVSSTQDFEILYSDVLAESIEFVGGHIRHIKVGEQIRIDYTVLPEGAYQVVEWSAPYDDPANPVLSVTKDGLITGLREGSELATAFCIDGSGWYSSVNIFVEALSGVENITDVPSRIKVSTVDGRIIVTGAATGSVIRVFSSDGSLLAFAEARGVETTFSLSPGFYIVNADGQSFKVKL